MTTMRTLVRRTTVAALLAATLLTVAETTEASSIGYALDTSGLNPAAGVYSLDFQLTSNDASGANSATIASLSIAGGALLSSQAYAPQGGFSGSLASAVVLTTSAFFSSFTQDFTPGSMLSFVLDLTNVAPTGPIPDAFSFAILLNGIELATNDPSGANKLLTYDLVGGGSPVGTANGLVASAPVPEPSTYALFGLGLVVLLGARARRRAH